MFRRRDLVGLIAAALSASAARAGDAPGVQPLPHDMSSMPANWTGSEKIAFLVYPEFTALDMVGPHYMFTSLMGATTLLVAKDRNPVVSDSGLSINPSATFEECPRDLDIICVPGGSAGTLAAMQDDATIAFLSDRGQRARFVTSVCTGSLLLGAAGLLQGYKATSHWLARDLLGLFGAIPTEGRFVRDRNRMTGGGVTAGIDFGLALVGELRDRPYAETVQLLAEYAPAPPYNSGRPQDATEETRTMLASMFQPFRERVGTVGPDVFARNRKG